MLELVRHKRHDSSADWGTEVVTGHPPIPDVLPALRKRVLGRTYRAHEPTVWWPFDVCWAAVTDLHKQGQHDDASALAKLLLWCDQRGHEQAWEIREAAGVSA